MKISAGTHLMIEGKKIVYISKKNLKDFSVLLLNYIYDTPLMLLNILNVYCLVCKSQLRNDIIQEKQVDKQIK